MRPNINNWVVGRRVWWRLSRQARRLKTRNRRTRGWRRRWRRRSRHSVFDARCAKSTHTSIGRRVKIYIIHTRVVNRRSWLGVSGGQKEKKAAVWRARGPACRARARARARTAAKPVQCARAHAPQHVLNQSAAGRLTHTCVRTPKKGGWERAAAAASSRKQKCTGKVSVGERERDEASAAQECTLGVMYVYVRARASVARRGEKVGVSSKRGARVGGRKEKHTRRRQ